MTCSPLLQPRKLLFAWTPTQVVSSRLKKQFTVVIERNARVRTIDFFFDNKVFALQFTPLYCLKIVITMLQS